MRVSALFLLALAACPKSLPGSLSHPAAGVADQFLSTLHEEDTEGMRALLNAKNQRMVRPKNLPRLLAWFREQVGDVRKVSEVRYREGYDQLVAKVRVLGDEVIVVLLTEEGATYRVEDVNSPPVASYEALPVLAP